MRTERVYTNETCNQNCGFCNKRQPRERREFVHLATVKERIDAALARQPQTLVLTGGEPTLRRDVSVLVRRAKQRGAAVVELETNASLVTPERAEELARAGLDVARVHMPAWNDDYARVTRDPHGFEAALSGMRAFAQAGVRLETSAAVARENATVLPRLPEQLKQTGLPIEALTLCPVLEAPNGEAPLTLSELATTIELTEHAARLASIDLRLDQHTFVPPCLFEDPGRSGHLFALTPGGARRRGYVHAKTCARCVVQERCPGVPEARVAETTVRPLTEDRVRRRLSIISTVEEQIARELVQDELERQPGGEAIPSRTVRINFRCNQACHFCFVSTHLPSASEEAIRAAISDVARRGGILILSGGEPTLNPNLVDYVHLGWAEGARGIELQTNAIRLRDPKLCGALAEAGLTFAFISLHGSTAEVADTVTAAPGTFAQQIRGIDEAVRHGIPVRLNFVFNEHNREDFPRYVEMVADRWPSAAITVSFVAPSTDVVPRTPDLIPRYSDVLPLLAEGIRLGERLGVSVSGFESMCGIPLCLVPTDIESYFELSDIPAGMDRGEFIQADACLSCSLQKKCFGVRRGYAALYGTDEFRPVRRADR